MDDLSDEENELEDLNMNVHNRGYSFLVPIGRTLTQQEEKNDQAEEDDGEGKDDEYQSNEALPSGEEEEGEEWEEAEDVDQDLDASLEDFDNPGLSASMMYPDDEEEVGDGTVEEEVGPLLA